MTRQKKSIPLPKSAKRLLLGIALGGVVAALGCQGPGTPADSGGSGLVASNVQPIPFTQDSPSDLPSAAIDSDLPPDQQSAMVSLLDSASLQDYMPTDLIHDGGVSLFRTLALAVPTAAAPQATKSSAPPALWGRQDVARGGRALTVRKDDSDPSARQARVTISYQMAGTLRYRYDANDKPVSKHFTERYTRAFQLKLAHGAWALTKVSPIQIVSIGSPADFQIADFSFLHQDTSVPTPWPVELSRLTPLEQQPNFAPGETIQLNLHVHQSAPGNLFAFANTVGGAGERGARTQMHDQVSQSDNGATDHTFTLTMSAPSSLGLHHFALDVVDAQSFQPGGVYRGVALGVTFKVQASGT